MQANVRLADMNLGAARPDDERRIECLVTGGLALWKGAQIAVDATFVSPLKRNGEARPKAATCNGIPLEEEANRKRNKTYPEFRDAAR